MVSESSWAKYYKLFTELTLMVNMLISYSGIVSVWFVLDADGTYKGCPLTAGYIINPFFSEICGVPLTQLPDDDASRWSALQKTSIVYFIFSVLLFLGYLFKDIGNYEGKKYFAIISFFDFLIFLLVCISIGFFNAVEAPANSSKAFSFILLVIALLISLSRLLYRLWYYTGLGEYLQGQAKKQINKRSAGKIYSIIE